MGMATVVQGDCLEVMKIMEDNTVDAVVTDPPYGIGFMGKHWDHGVPSKDVWSQCLRVLKPGGHLLSFAGTRTQHRMCCNIEDVGFEIRDMIAWIYGQGYPKGSAVLKPSMEPITVAKKSGDSWLNVEECRVPCFGEGKGRWPANVIHDGSEDVLGCFPEAPGQQGDLKAHNKCRQSPNGIFGGMRPALDHPARDDGGVKSAARFFYCAKANKTDRAGSNHPTVKPIDLMRYLCRLVTPPGGLILDPFAGSGTTGQAAVEEGFRCLLIEREAEYVRDISRRLGII